MIRKFRTADTKRVMQIWGLDEATGSADYTLQWKRVWTEGERSMK